MYHAKYSYLQDNGAWFTWTSDRSFKTSQGAIKAARKYLQAQAAKNGYKNIEAGAATWDTNKNTLVDLYGVPIVTGYTR